MKRWHKVGLGIGVVIIILMGAGILALAGLRNLLYPVATPMPAVVSEPMPAILARLDALLKTNAPHVSSLLQPGLSAGQISKLEEQYHVQLPDDIRLIYEWHNGSRFTTNYVSKEFIPGYRFVPLDEELADRSAELDAKASRLQHLAYRVLAGHRDSWICLFRDEAGDGYWFDPQRKPAEGAVFFNDNEEAMYVFFPSPKNLMAGVAQCYEQGAFHLKAGSAPPQLEENFDQSGKIWPEFGVTKE